VIPLYILGVYPNAVSDKFATRLVTILHDAPLKAGVDIRVGTIERVEDIERSEKLVRLLVDFGDHKRTILVGMKKERSNPKAEIEGKQALFVINLPVRTMAGEKSEGMIFDIGFSDGILPRLAVPESAVPNGARAG
jgi:tRNA-binding protein